MRCALLLGFLGWVLIGCSEMDRDRCLDRGGKWDEASQTCITKEPPQIALHEQDSTRYYTYKISYPEIIRSNDALHKEMKEYAEEQKQQFLQFFDRDSIPKSASYPWDLLLDFAVQDSASSFVSILGTGYAFTGGAHGHHFFKTLNYDRSRSRLITLYALFADTTALALISEAIRPPLQKQLAEKMKQQTDQQLKDWLTKGTAPTRENYQYFLLARPENGQPAGLIFLFPPYQVAPYYAGKQKVFVPTSVFKDGLSGE